MANLGNRIVNYVRGIFSRDTEERIEAAGGVNVGDFPMDPFGNLQVQHIGQNVVQDALMVSNALMARMIDYERMDEYPDCNAALNIYADDATVPDPSTNHVMWSVCRDEQIRGMLDTMLHRRLHVDDEAWEAIRMLVKYGNDFEEILVNSRGVQGLNFLPAPTCRRLEGKQGELKGFVQSFRGNFTVNPGQLQGMQFRQGVGREPRSGVALFEPWRVVHMRLRSNRRRAMYGIGILEACRWVWKRLILLEDAALISRLARAPSRFAFYVDVGKLSTENAEKYLDEMRRKLKKKKFVNPRTGQLDLRFNPLSTDEDFFLPVRDSREVVRADVLNTPTWTGVEDVAYFRDKLHASLMIPKAYLGYDENLPSRATLSQEDVRFARTVLRVQREYKAGMRKVAKVHLASQGIDPAYVDFDLAMTVPSSIFELARLEIQNTRATFAAQMGELVSKHWLLANVFNFSDAEIEKVMVQRREELTEEMKIQQGQFESRALPVRSPNRMLTDNRSAPARTRELYGVERDLFAGSREAEKRLEGRLDQMLTENRRFGMQLAQIQSFLGEVRGAIRTSQMPR